MCSVDDDGALGESSSPLLLLKCDFAINRIKASSKCIKCEEAAITVARAKDPFCRKCFFVYFNQRFRSTLGKLRLLQPGEKVLLAFSGGLSSRVLLFLVEHNMSEQVSKKLQIIPSILFIDEGAVINQNKVERSESVTDAMSIAKKSKFPSFFIALEQVFSSNAEIYEFTDSKGVVQNDDDLLEKLVGTFSNITSLTAKENLLITLRQRLLAFVAKKYGYSKVLVGDNANRVSTRLLGNFAQGRSSTIPLDTGIQDSRHEDVHIIRPLREFPQQEIKEFAHINNLESINLPTLQCRSKDVSSIESVTEAFINGLLPNFPSTVNTIFRTGEKLSVQANDSEANPCGLCKGDVRPIADERVFSHLSESNERLCYGCRLTLKDMVGDISYLALAKSGEK